MDRYRIWASSTGLRLKPATASDLASAEIARTRYVYILMGTLLLAFLAGAVRAAMLKPLWMDEVLSAWAIRLPTGSDVVSAHFHGSESCPPTYNLLLHYLVGVAGDSYVVMRLPAILATMGTGVCLFVLLRSVAGLEAAAFGMAFLLLGLVSEFAIQIRPYALVTLCFASAAVVWRDFDKRGDSLARTGLFCLLLIAAFSLHFYATLFIPCFGLMELAWTVRRRQVRVPVWGSFLVAGLATFLWLPLMSVFVASNKADTISLLYYARPIPVRLMESYGELSLRHPTGQKLVPITLASLALVCLMPRLRRIAGGRNKAYTGGGALLIILACSMALPLIVFAFAFLITGTFNIRYCLGGAIGIAGAVTLVLSRVPGWRLAIFPVLVAASAIALTRFQIRLPDFVPPPERVAENWPIVIGDGLQYFQIAEAAPDGLKQRIFYVNRPDGVSTPDPTNENLVDRWHTIRPDLNVVDAASFLAQTPHFYLLTVPETNDVLSPWLQEHGLIEGEAGHIKNARLYQVHGTAAGSPD